MDKEVTISTNEFSKISYTKHGSGDTVMLLHGFPENSSLWQNIVPELSEHFTVITPDIPGSGNSKLDKHDVRIEELAESINAILEKERIDNLVFAGHSMGGYIALAFAEKYPSKLRGLSLIHSTATADDEEKKKKRLKSINLIQKGGKEAFINEMVPNLFAKEFRNGNKGIIVEQIRRGMLLSEESMISFYNAMMNRKDRSSILMSAEYPIQMIIGQEDTIAPMNLLLEQSAEANIGFVSIYENSLHMSMIEHPDRLANDLINFTQYCFTKQ